MLVRSEFSRYSIVVGKSDNLSDVEFKVISEFTKKLLGGKSICTVAVGNKPEAFREFFEVSKSHYHCEDTGSYISRARDPVTND